MKAGRDTKQRVIPGFIYFGRPPVMIAFLYLFLIPFFFHNEATGILYSGQSPEHQTPVRPEGGDNDAINVSSIPTPLDFSRTVPEEGSFSDWVRRLPLKKGLEVMDYRGHRVHTGFDSIFAVIDKPLLFDQNLEQCADFAMRLWADYHKETDQLETLTLFEYDGTGKPFRTSGQSYNEFLRTAFAFSNSYSLKAGCAEVDPENVGPGDLIVQNERGGIGHVSMILDECRSEDGRRLYLIGYSYMPAQEFHIEKAGDEYGKDGWFSMEGYYRYLADHLDLGTPVLRRF